jgi:potassium-transporting ATPase KdpC subunit
MLAHLRPAIVMLALFTVLTGLAYPLAVTGIAQVLLPSAANGNLVNRDGAVVGSRLIAQTFAADKYFHARPSATTAPDPKDDTKTVDAPYNAIGSGGSNLGPTSKALVDRVTASVEELRKGGATVIPADAVTTSASGLDPHISPETAALQVARVAAARGVGEDKVRAVLASHVEGSLLGLVGEPRVNVLELNLALDAALAPAPG